MRSFVAGAVLAFVLATPAAAQTSLADIKAKLAGKTSELAEVDAMLAAPDKNSRVAAMELLLASGNPVFVQRAKEVGLFSSDPEMQSAALRAIFDAGGPFRVLLDLTTAKEDQTGARTWLSNYQGAWDSDGKVGSYTFSTRPYSEGKKCWQFLSGSNCAFTITGTSVSLGDWSNVAGTLTLDSAGSLTGSFRVTYDRKYVPIPATIPLAE